MNAPHGHEKTQRKKLKGNNSRMMRAVFNKSWNQHPTKQLLYLPLISETIQIRWTRHRKHCWRSMGRLISNVFLWTPAHECASIGWPARIYLHQLCADTGCSLEDLPRTMDDGEREREREREPGNYMLSVRLGDNNNDDFYLDCEWEYYICIYFLAFCRWCSRRI